ncbi:MAG: hypothetical protein QM523_01750 [Candidatus Pacebacteria bacterium]|nr:hypothetical protein [Candidatus Paceibacterota bacterium]
MIFRLNHPSTESTHAFALMPEPFTQIMDTVTAILALIDEGHNYQSGLNFRLFKTIAHIR